VSRFADFLGDKIPSFLLKLIHEKYPALDRSGYLARDQRLFPDLDQF